MSDLQENYGIFLDGVDNVRASMCENCGGIPQAPWLPYWVYDEFTECTCAANSCCDESEDT